MIPLKLNLKDLLDLDDDLKASSRAIPAIVRSIMRLQLRESRRELLPLVPRRTGALARSLGYSIKKQGSQITGKLGFMTGRRVSRGTAIAASVLQKPGATARKGSIWIPIPGVSITPTQFRSLPGSFIQTSAKGNRIAFQRQADTVVPLFVLKKAVKLSAPPLPLDRAGVEAAEEMTQQIPEVIAQAIVAKKAALNRAFE